MILAEKRCINAAGMNPQTHNNQEEESMKRLCALFAVALLAGIAACSSSGGPSTVGVSLVPTDGSSVQTTTPITATFSAALDAANDTAANWNGHMTLVSVDAGSGTDLCSGNIAYANLTATCSATLTGGSYRLTITGVKDATGAIIDDKVSTFFVESLIFNRTSISTTAEDTGESDLTFTFNAAQTTLPAATIQNLTDGTPAQAMPLSTSDNKTFTAALSNLGGCKQIVDYAIVLTYGSDSKTQTFKFNSADDEFIWKDGVTVANMVANDSSTCWELMAFDPTMIDHINKGGDHQLTLNSVTANIGGNYFGLNAIRKGPLTSDFAVSMQLVGSTAAIADTGAVNNVLSIETDAGPGDPADVSAMQGGIHEKFNASGDIPASDYTGLGALKVLTNFGLPSSGGFITPLAGSLFDGYELSDNIYLCNVQKDHIATYYASLDGVNYTQLTGDNMACSRMLIGSADINCADDPTQVTQTQMLTSPSNLKAVIMSAVYYAGTADTASLTAGYVRFNATGITGSAADCPRLQ